MQNFPIYRRSHRRLWNTTRATSVKYLNVLGKEFSLFTTENALLSQVYRPVARQVIKMRNVQFIEAPTGIINIQPATHNIDSQESEQDKNHREEGDHEPEFTAMWFPEEENLNMVETEQDNTNGICQGHNHYGTNFPGNALRIGTREVQHTMARENEWKAAT